MTGESHVVHVAIRSFRVVVLTLLISAISTAANGVIGFRVRDSVTGYAVDATVKLEAADGDQFAPLSLRTDNFGRLRRELPVGRYLVEVSAPGYRTLRSPFEVRPGTNASAEVLALPPENPPEELGPEALEPKLSPGHSLVHGYVVDAETGKPVRGVRIRLEKAQMQTQTNDRGYFWVSVPTPSVDALGLPGEDSLTAELSGYKSYIYRNFLVPEGDIGTFGFSLERGTGISEYDATHKLKRRPSERKDSEPPPRPPRAELAPAVPPMVRVTWRGVFDWSSSESGDPRAVRDHRSGLHSGWFQLLLKDVLHKGRPAHLGQGTSWRITCRRGCTRSGSLLGRPTR